MVVDAGSGELLYTEPYGALAFEFLTNGKMLLTSGHCEGAYMRILDPATSQLDVLGDGSYQLWNPRKTAFVVTASPYHGLESTLWGYSVIEDFVFLQQPVVWQSDNHPLWTPDGTHVMFLRRALIREDSVYNFPSPRQIVRVEAATGRETILLEDPRYDFHLCANAYSWCDIWYGDWVQVRRFPFQPQTVDDSLDVYGPQTNCLEYGEDCPQDPDLFALNSRTGELIPWDADLFPPPTPRPKFTAGPGMG